MSGRWFAALTVLVLAGATPARATCSLTAGPERTVARIIDAETVLLDDGSRVRLANMLAPRAVDSGQAKGLLAAENAATAALDNAARGKTVRLRYDAVRTDRHGTARAHLMLLTGGRETWLQTQVLATGQARVDARGGERSCLTDLLAAEDVARANGTGLWSESAFRIRPAIPARELTSYRGTFQIVTGDVHSVEAARDLIRLILGPDRRRDFSVSLRANDRDMLGPLGGDAHALVGKTVEARGWIDQRPGLFSGPDIDVSLTGHVRLYPRR